VLEPNLIVMDLDIIVSYKFLADFLTAMLIATDINVDACNDGKFIDEPRTARRGNCTEGCRRWMGGWIAVLQSVVGFEMGAGWP
jgi:hypothetical protein